MDETNELRELAWRYAKTVFHEEYLDMHKHYDTDLIAEVLGIMIAKMLRHDISIERVCRALTFFALEEANWHELGERYENPSPFTTNGKTEQDLYGVLYFNRPDDMSFEWYFADSEEHAMEQARDFHRDNPYFKEHFLLWVIKVPYIVLPTPNK